MAGLNPAIFCFFARLHAWWSQSNPSPRPGRLDRARPHVLACLASSPGTILHESGLEPMRGNWVRSQPMNKDTNPAAGHTILVVEDEPLVRMDISEALRHHGYRVLEAANGDDALKLLAEGKTIHLVFTDVRMPGRSDGFDVARRAEQ